MFIDLKREILAALASPEGRDLLRELVNDIGPARLVRAPDAEADRLISAKEAALLLGMTERAVRQAAHRGTLPAVHLGRRLRFKRGDLLKRAA
jgi:excisionase family DNA binding protein